MKGYKIFEPDWTCRGKQYACPGEFQEEVDLSVCNRGMHFCEKMANCFNYYQEADETYKYAEVEALGDIVTVGDKSCTNHLRIVKELTFEEVKKLTNSGNRNSGDRNSGNRNSGNCNSGDWNSGNWNSGNRNSGNCNSGDWNSGNWNSGNWNSGDWNSGNWNSGNCNSGNRNSGNWNSGDWNKSSYNNGCFMTIEPKIQMYNKQSDWTLRDWYNSKARTILRDMPQDIDVIDWIPANNMTDAEKEEHPTYKTTGGYIKVTKSTEDKQAWWDALYDQDKAIVMSLPNFDAEIFKQCTGIEVQHE